MAAGTMQERTGNWFAGVAQSVLEIVCIALLSAASSLLVWELWHHTETQHSAAEKTSVRVEIRRVLVAAPLVVLVNQHINAACDVTFALNFSRHWRYISERSSFTPRYVGVALN